MSNPKVTTVEDLLACMHRMRELRNEFIKSGGCDMFVCSTDAWNAIRRVTQPANPPPNISLVGHFGGIPVLVADTQKEVLAIMAQAALDGKHVQLVGWSLTYDPLLNGLDTFFSSTPN